MPLQYALDVPPQTVRQNRVRPCPILEKLEEWREGWIDWDAVEEFFQLISGDAGIVQRFESKPQSFGDIEFTPFPASHHISRAIYSTQAGEDLKFDIVGGDGAVEVNKD